MYLKWMNEFNNKIVIYVSKLFSKITQYNEYNASTAFI